MLALLDSCIFSYHVLFLLWQPPKLRKWLQCIHITSFRNLINWVEFVSICSGGEEYKSSSARHSRLEQRFTLNPFRLSIAHAASSEQCSEHFGPWSNHCLVLIAQLLLLIPSENMSHLCCVICTPVVRRTYHSVCRSDTSASASLVLRPINSILVFAPAKQI
jgi:hypothetical protein